MNSKHLITAATLWLCATALVAGGRPDFTGEFLLNKTRSRLEFPKIGDLDRGTVTIIHVEPRFKFSRVFVTRGEDDALTWELKTDGVESTTADRSIKEISKLYWDGDVLVFETRMITSRGEATNVVHYRLLDDGKTLEAHEEFKGPRHRHDNLWIFDRADPK